jgi:hypothetical protein
MEIAVIDLATDLHREDGNLPYFVRILKKNHHGYFFFISGAGNRK